MPGEHICCKSHRVISRPRTEAKETDHYIQLAYDDAEGLVVTQLNGETLSEILRH